jgi:hypothetical protein
MDVDVHGPPPTYLPSHQADAIDSLFTNILFTQDRPPECSTCLETYHGMCLHGNQCDRCHRETLSHSAVHSLLHHSPATRRCPAPLPPLLRCQECIAPPPLPLNNVCESDDDSHKRGKFWADTPPRRALAKKQPEAQSKGVPTVDTATSLTSVPSDAVLLCADLLTVPPPKVLRRAQRPYHFFGQRPVLTC